MLKIAVVGYGNIGKAAVEAIKLAPDMQLVGLVRRNAGQCPPELAGTEIVSDINALAQKPDAAILAVPTRQVESYAKACLKEGICTVDSFDIHTQIVELRRSLQSAAKEGGATAVIASGWDPGSDSIVRTILEAAAPVGITYTNFGPGMSMGHTVAVKAIAGVENALSMTMPKGAGVHGRIVYVKLKEGAKFEEVAAAIKADPYFVKDDTQVFEAPDIEKLIDRGHGVNMVRKGSSSGAQNQNFSFNMSIDNPALTAQIMVSCARAAKKLAPGAYTLVEIPPVYMLVGDLEENISRLV